MASSHFPRMGILVQPGGPSLASLWLLEVKNWKTNHTVFSSLLKFWFYTLKDTERISTKAGRTNNISDESLN